MKTYSLKLYDVQFERLRKLRLEKLRIHEKSLDSASEDAPRLMEINMEIAGIICACLDRHDGEADQ